MEEEENKEEKNHSFGFLSRTGSAKLRRGEGKLTDNK